jgi:hypothetical protein
MYHGKAEVGIKTGEAVYCVSLSLTSQVVVIQKEDDLDDHLKRLLDDMTAKTGHPGLNS